MMQADDFDTLALLVPGHKRIIEVGCFAGALTKLFCLFAEHVWSVDWFEGDSAAGRYSHDDVLACYKENNEESLASGKLELLEMDSDHGAAVLAERGVTADLIWIDADHSYEHCAADIRNYLPLLEPGGVICGHDAGPFEGVTQAVDELLPNALFAPGTIWFWREGVPQLEQECQVFFRSKLVPQLQAAMFFGALPD